MADHESKKSKTTTLARSEAGQLATIPSENPFLRLIERVMDDGITEKSAEVMGKLVAVFRDVEKDIAAKAHAAAMADLQAELPKVQARHAIRATNGTVRSEYASYDDLMDQVHAAMAKYGFFVKYDAEHHGDKMTAVCKMTHRGGHTEETRYTTRISAAAGGNSASQADTGAMTTAKRNALCNALNIVVGDERDARNEGDTISAEEADELATRAQALVAGGHGSMAQWLALGGVTDDGGWESVRTVKAGVVRAEMANAERKASVPPCPPDARKWHDAVEGLFQEKGKASADFAAWLAGATKKHGKDSYLTLTPEQRAESWIKVHAWFEQPPVGTVGHKK